MECNVGDTLRCPECGSVRAKVIWKSRNGKTIGIKCPRSGYRHKRNSVILIELEDYKLHILETPEIMTRA